MPNVPLSYLPGVIKTVSPYATSKESGSVDGRPVYGRFIDMEGARFRGGYPEKLGGSTSLTSSTMVGVARSLKDWRDFNQVIYVGSGTNAKLYVYSNLVLTDITPLRGILTGTLTNALSTTIGSAVVSVNHTAHGLQTGDCVILTAASSVGGLTIGGVYFVTTIVDANNYTFTNISNATSSQASGGGSISYTYFRITIANPFDTVSGSSSVTVHHNNHGSSVGDYVTISGASAVGGLTLSGSYSIVTSSANSYTITASGNASSTVSGGGGTPNFQYDVSAGLVDSALSFGYGTGGYGGNGYGTTGTTSISLSARTWSLDNYGQQLLSNPNGGTIYIWDPARGGRSYPMYNAPAACNFMFVTPERFVVALGVNGNPMKMAWCDQNDYTVWTSTPTNTANSGRTLQEGSQLMGGLSTRNGTSMIFSDNAAYSMEYTGDNNVYSTIVAAKKCGSVGALAQTALGDKIFWMTDNDFWFWNGSAQGMDSADIRAYVYGDINIAQQAKFVAGTINGLNEVVFFYCSSASQEINRWVRWHDDQGCWSKGSVMSRTAWLDKNLLDYPIAATSSGNLYYQEYGNDDNGGAIDSYVEFCPFDISNGDQQMDVFGFIPDFLRVTGNMTLTVKTQDYPKSSQNIDGPYTIAPDTTTPIIDLRSSGRLIGYKLESNVMGGDWRLGLPSVNVQPAGARR